MKLSSAGWYFGQEKVRSIITRLYALFALLR